MNLNTKIDYIKSCKALLHTKIDNLNCDIVNTELIRFYPIDKLCNKDNYNDYLRNLLKNIILEKSPRYIQNSNEIYHVGQTELYNVSRILQYPDNVQLPG